MVHNLHQMPDSHNIYKLASHCLRGIFELIKTIERKKIRFMTINCYMQLIETIERKKIRFMTINCYMQLIETIERTKIRFMTINCYMQVRLVVIREIKKKKIHVNKG